MVIDSLSIEVTRRCNIKCAHCLRGGAQRKDINLAHVSKFFALRDIDSIGCLCLSGGEPSLVPNIISGISYALTHYGIEVGYFYIATNGTRVTDAFINAVKYLHGTVYDPGSCMIQVSMDKYHKIEDPKRLAYDGLDKLQEELGSIIDVRDRNNSDSYRYFDVIGEGRAKTNQMSFTPAHIPKLSLVGEGSQLEGNLYLNAEGWVIEGGDFSYISQKKHRLFHVDNAVELSLAASLGFVSTMYKSAAVEEDEMEYANA